MARKSYTQEFRESAVRLANQPDASIDATARDLGIATETLRRWMRSLSPSAHTGDSEPDLRRRVRELEAQVRTLRMERDILKKATAFFAKERP